MPSKPKRVRVHRKPRSYTGRRGHRGCVQHKDARSTKGWGAAKPSSGQRIRRGVAKRCGASAFLEHRRDGTLHYVVRDPKSCCLDCRAIREAKQRASQHRHPGLVKKAHALGKRAGCSWAKGR